MPLLQGPPLRVSVQAHCPSPSVYSGEIGSLEKSKGAPFAEALAPASPSARSSVVAAVTAVASAATAPLRNWIDCRFCF